MLRIAVLASALLFALCAPALAQELSDDDYVARAFGTVAVLHAPRQVANPNETWWGEKAAQELTNTSYLIGIINSRRMDKGIKVLLDPNDSNTIFMDAEETDEAGFRYPISFANMRPSEVKALIEVLGGPGKLLPGATRVSYEPLQRRWMSAGSYDGTSPIVLQIGPHRIESTAAVNFDELRGRVDSALQQMFGHSVPFDFTVTRSMLMDGMNTTDVSIYVDLNPRPAYDDVTFDG